MTSCGAGVSLGDARCVMHASFFVFGRRGCQVQTSGSTYPGATSASRSRSARSSSFLTYEGCHRVPPRGVRFRMSSATILGGDLKDLGNESGLGGHVATASVVNLTLS